MSHSPESGSHIVTLGLAIVVLAVVAFAGYRVWELQQAPAMPASTTATTTAPPAAITNTATLNQASSALDSAASQVNSSLDDNLLNAAINKML